MADDHHDWEQVNYLEVWDRPEYRWPYVRMPWISPRFVCAHVTEWCMNCGCLRHYHITPCGEVFAERYLVPGTDAEFEEPVGCRRQ
jgi:hypothetical protein